MNSGLIYAHRGVSSEFLENSRSAFDQAVKTGVDGIETDIQISRDHISVLWHDSHLGKLGLPESLIGELNYAELSQLQLSDYGPTDREEIGLVTLEEFIPQYARRCQVILEVKNLDWDRNTGRHQINIRHCLETAKRHAGQGNDSGLLISSFDLESLLYAYSQEPEQPLVLNMDDGFLIDDLKRSLDDHDFFRGYCLPIDDLDSRACQLIVDRGKSIIVYTCNSAEQIRKAFDLNVDILISDCPQKAFELRG